MELKKTTILSAFVMMAGILAEIIFQGVFSRTLFGIILSILLAIVVLVSFYFTMDGIICWIQGEHQTVKKIQKDYEQKLYGILNDQLKFQKAIFNEVKLLQSLEENNHKQISEAVKIPEEIPVMETSEPMVCEISPEIIEQLVSSVNAYTETISSKIIEAFGTTQSNASVQLLDAQDAVKDDILLQFESLLAAQNESIQAMLSQITEDMAAMQPETSVEDLYDESYYDETMETQEEVLETPAITAQDLQQVIDSINDYTLQSAKVVAKYVGKSTDEIKDILKDSVVKIRKSK